MAEKFFCFEANGAPVFQGARSSIIQRLKVDYALCMILVHGFGHRTDLAIEAMFGLSFMQKLEDLHFYFSASHRRHFEYTNFMKL